MKAVLISIQPKWCELIASGKKTVEVRKTKPKLEMPFKVYIYCTKGETVYLPKDIFGNEPLNGKVIGEFVCKAVLPIAITYSDPNSRIALREFPFTCLTDKEIMDYLGNGVTGYGWTISDLIIYDKPKELSEFYRYCGDDPKCDGCEAHYYYSSECGLEDECCSLVYGCRPLTRPPQSWCYVERLGEG